MRCQTIFPKNRLLQHTFVFQLLIECCSQPPHAPQPLHEASQGQGKSCTRRTRWAQSLAQSQPGLDARLKRLAAVVTYSFYSGDDSVFTCFYTSPSFKGIRFTLRILWQVQLHSPHLGQHCRSAASGCFGNSPLCIRQRPLCVLAQMFVWILDVLCAICLVSKNIISYYITCKSVNQYTIKSTFNHPITMRSPLKANQFWGSSSFIRASDRLQSTTMSGELQYSMASE